MATNQDRVNLVNAIAAEWLDEDGPSDFTIDGVDFEFIYADTSKGDRWEVWSDGEMIGWNDCYKDFYSICYCVDAYLSSEE